MTVRELIATGIFKVVNIGSSTDTVISKPFCCDLLSVAMSKAPERAAWVTVMANMNTLAVASLTESACVIMAENAEMDETAVTKASQQGITVLATKEPIFETAMAIEELLKT